MRVYNAEFFRPDYSYITNRIFSDLEYSYDYVSPDINSFIVEAITGVSSGDYIQISDGDEIIYGIVDHIDEGADDKGLSEVFFRQMTALFDVPILFDTDLQPGAGAGSTVSCEQMIADIITAMYGSNPDALQVIPGLDVQTISLTSDWGFNLKSTYEGMHRLIINFWESILSRALTKYQIVIDVIPDFAAKTMTVIIGRKDLPLETIEADLPDIIDKSIVYETQASTNKVVIYNGADYSKSVTYYLHPDGTYDTSNRDRITPVIFDVRDVSMEEEGADFAKLARSEAVDVFGGAAINNNITLTMIGHRLPEIGQEVAVISEGVTYRSMVTGYTRGALDTIVCGTVRAELTKLI